MKPLSWLAKKEWDLAVANAERCTKSRDMVVSSETLIQVNRLVKMVQTAIAIVDEEIDSRVIVALDAKLAELEAENVALQTKKSPNQGC